MAAQERKKLNGSVDRLAEALRDVVREGVQEAVEPLRKEMQDGFEAVDKSFEQVDKRIEDANRKLAGLRADLIQTRGEA